MRLGRPDVDYRTHPAIVLPGSNPGPEDRVTRTTERCFNMRSYEAPAMTEIGRVEDLTETIVVIATGETS